ncbi:MAG: hypothetical protein GXY65_09705 [Rhodococcus sp.]|nr:hypothetical protein [Rhodococcus sp. (in: high G+C Gram-positive bacteria)]NLV79595.1 hypothetical protein [Rhodococcus sp. (in: high G+C Gram-positive bacteria)]
MRTSGGSRYQKCARVGALLDDVDEDQLVAVARRYIVPMLDPPRSE